MTGRVALDINRDFVDGRVRQDETGGWWLLRSQPEPPAGFRGQWSGWVEWPISARKARKLLRMSHDVLHCPLCPDHPDHLS